MNTHADKAKKSENTIVVNKVLQKEGGESTFQFVDNRPEAATQRMLQEIASDSPQTKRAAQLQVLVDNYTAEQPRPIQKKVNNTGLPDNLKSGIENLSGYSMDDVKVHYNSDKPAQLQAHAYAQGTNIHLAPGQEKHLPHEAWHVIQQKQGRVKPTMQLKGIVNINDDASLEKEADLMGNKALQNTYLSNTIAPKDKSIIKPSIQRKKIDELVVAIGAVMDEGKLKKEQIIAGLKKLPKQDIDDPNFPRSLVDFVKSRNGVSDFSIKDLESAPDPKFGKKHINKKWTFRHYTNVKHDTLKSLASLEAEGINASANTNDKDWEELGNQGYVFGLISIDGEVPNRTWLSSFKYYAEYDLNDLSSVWVSGDMLDDEGRKVPSYQGSGPVIIAMLSKMLGFIDQKAASAIDEKFASKLEAKIPPSALTKPDWKEA